MAELAYAISQYKLIGPDGTVQYVGAALVMNAFLVKSLEASALAIAGEAVRLDVAASATVTIPRFERFASGAAVDADIPQELSLGVFRISAATNILLCGVLTGDMPAGKLGVAAGAGSLVCVQSRPSASLTANTRGSKIIGSATAGQVDARVLNAAGAATNLAADATVLGMVVKPAGVAAGTTGDDAQLGALVAPW